MLLAVDVGNTDICFGVFDGEDIAASFKLTTKVDRTKDEFEMCILNMLHNNEIRTSDIEGVIVASVVPGIMTFLLEGLQKCFHIEPLIVGAGIKTGINLKAVNPKDIGSDRVVKCVAANEIYGGPAIVVDFGTATTYDLVLENGTVTAGITCPGIRVSANALWQEASRLPEFEIKKPRSILTTDTVTSMQAGVYYGCIGQTEYIINQIKKEADLDDVKVVVTGDLGKKFAEDMDIVDIFDKDLAMKGLCLIYHKNARTKYEKFK